MRFLCVYKSGKPEGVPPTQEEMASMGKLIQEAMSAGWLLSTEGCLPSKLGARVKLADDKYTVTDGPFTETKELIGGFAIIQAKSKEEAIDLTALRLGRILIRRGLAALDRAERLGGSNGPYAIQAAIAACHARARTAKETDWTRIAALYEELAEVAPSPIIELNRAVAVAMADGPAEGLKLLEALASEPLLWGIIICCRAFAEISW